MPKVLPCLPEPMGHWFSMIFALLSSMRRGNCKRRKSLQLFPLAPSHLTSLIKNHLFLEQLYTHPKFFLNLNSHSLETLCCIRFFGGNRLPPDTPPW